MAIELIKLDEKSESSMPENIQAIRMFYFSKLERR